MKKGSFLSKVFSIGNILALLLVTFYSFHFNVARAATNPPMPESCGVDMVLVIDTSTSIVAADRVKMKAAFSSFVDSVLPATPAKIAVVSFNTTATVNLKFSTDPATIKSAINAIGGSGYTNWEAALALAQIQFPSDGKPHLIVFTSDGDPTTSDTGGPVVTTQPNNHLNPAIIKANAAWTAGTRIITLGVGASVNVKNLIAISSADASYTATSFSTLSATLQDLVTKLCGGKIIITNYIDLDGNPATTNDQTLGGGWNFTVAGTNTVTDPVTGMTQPISIVGKSGPFDVLMVSKPGYVSVYVSCVNTTKNNEPVGTSTVMDIINGINVTTDDIISCVFYNKPGLPPTGTLTASDCVIPPGAKSCNTSLTWATQNPLNSVTISKVTTPTNITVATGNSGTNVPYSIDYGSRNFFLYHNGDPYLAMATANATCGDATVAFWDGTAQKCVGVLSGTLKVDAGLGGPYCYISKGHTTCTTSLTIDIKNPVAGKVTEITKVDHITVASFAPGVTLATKTGVEVGYPSTTFFLYHDGKSLDTLVVNAMCNPTENTHWGGTGIGCVDNDADGEWKVNCGACNPISCLKTCTNECISHSKGNGRDCPPGDSFPVTCHEGSTCLSSGELNIKFNGAPTKIFKGRKTVLTWSSNGDKCVGSTNKDNEKFDTSNKPSSDPIIGVTVTPQSTTIYTITCSDTGRDVTESKQITINVDTMNIHEK